MKKILFLFLFSCLLTSVFAKKVKFSVDMTGQDLTAFGIHVAGDFQKALGLPSNWLFDKTRLIKEKKDTNVYSLVVDLPAFKKFEYKFVNGDQDYQAEFVPLESRVGYNFVDNRWLYIDSLANDTTFVGTIQYEKNAPKGFNLLRFKVHLKDVATIAKEGVHVAGNFQAWNPKTTIMYSFEKKVYDIITYVKSGTYEFKYLNGNTNATYENVPAACATNNNRTVKVSNHIVLDPICFSDCVGCKPSVAVQDVYDVSTLVIAPNPVQNGFWLNNILPNSTLQITSVEGKKIFSENTISESYYIDSQYFTKGIYFLNIENKETKTRKVGKFVVE